MTRAVAAYSRRPEAPSTVRSDLLRPRGANAASFGVALLASIVAPLVVVEGLPFRRCGSLGHNATLGGDFAQQTNAYLSLGGHVLSYSTRAAFGRCAEQRRSARVLSQWKRRYRVVSSVLTSWFISPVITTGRRKISRVKCVLKLELSYSESLRLPYEERTREVIKLAYPVCLIGVLRVRQVYSLLIFLSGR